MNSVTIRAEKFGVMGGTFDPIHYGHLIAAERAREELALDKVLFIPSGKPPHKQAKTALSSLDRYRMAELAIASNVCFQISDIEIKRDGASYTIDTLKALLELYSGAQFYFITGADAILEIATWKDPVELLSLCNFVAVTRPGYNLDNIWRIAGDFIKFPEKKIIGLTIPGLDISSTEIRGRLREGRSVKYMLPDDVIDFITERGLYRFSGP
ncbi:MAG: nicotinate-nucleotide adenylyltransferase [Peptococcaceae bacterium]|nr:nicotinate-nucleotide adenylyltransferase [Peptococcaceae bacterium]